MDSGFPATEETRTVYKACPEYVFLESEVQNVNSRTNKAKEREVLVITIEDSSDEEDVSAKDTTTDQELVVEVEEGKSLEGAASDNLPVSGNWNFLLRLPPPTQQDYEDCKSQMCRSASKIDRRHVNLCRLNDEDKEIYEGRERMDAAVELVICKFCGMRIPPAFRESHMTTCGEAEAMCELASYELQEMSEVETKEFESSSASYFVDQSVFIAQSDFAAQTECDSSNSTEIDLSECDDIGSESEKEMPLLKPEVALVDVESDQSKTVIPTPDTSLHPKPEVSNKKKYKKRRHGDPYFLVPLKDRSFDPELHCGVLVDGRPCTRTVTCKHHTVADKRNVDGRPLDITVLINNHKARTKKVAQNSQGRRLKNNKRSGRQFQKTINDSDLGESECEPKGCQNQKSRKTDNDTQSIQKKRIPNKRGMNSDEDLSQKHKSRLRDRVPKDEVCSVPKAKKCKYRFQDSSELSEWSDSDTSSSHTLYNDESDSSSGSDSENHSVTGSDTEREEENVSLESLPPTVPNSTSCPPPKLKAAVKVTTSPSHRPQSPISKTATHVNRSNPAPVAGTSASKASVNEERNYFDTSSCYYYSLSDITCLYLNDNNCPKTPEPLYKSKVGQNKDPPIISNPPEPELQFKLPEPQAIVKKSLPRTNQVEPAKTETGQAPELGIPSPPIPVLLPQEPYLLREETESSPEVPHLSPAFVQESTQFETSYSSPETDSQSEVPELSPHVSTLSVSDNSLDVSGSSPLAPKRPIPDSHLPMVEPTNSITMPDISLFVSDTGIVNSTVSSKDLIAMSKISMIVPENTLAEADCSQKISENSVTVSRKDVIEDYQPSLQNSIVVSDDSQSTLENSIVASDNSQPSLENSIIASDNSLPTLENSIVASDISTIVLDNSILGFDIPYAVSDNYLQLTYASPETLVSSPGAPDWFPEMPSFSHKLPDSCHEVKNPCYEVELLLNDDPKFLLDELSERITEVKSLIDGSEERIDKPLPKVSDTPLKDQILATPLHLIPLPPGDPIRRKTAKPKKKINRPTRFKYFRTTPGLIIVKAKPRRASRNTIELPIIPDNQPRKNCRKIRPSTAEVFFHNYPTPKTDASVSPLSQTGDENFESGSTVRSQAGFTIQETNHSQVIACEDQSKAKLSNPMHFIEYHCDTPMSIEKVSPVVNSKSQSPSQPPSVEVWDENPSIEEIMESSQTNVVPECSSQMSYQYQHPFPTADPPNHGYGQVLDMPSYRNDPHPNSIVSAHKHQKYVDKLLESVTLLKKTDPKSSSGTRLPTPWTKATSHKPKQAKMDLLEYLTDPKCLAGYMPIAPEQFYCSNPRNVYDGAPFNFRGQEQTPETTVGMFNQEQVNFPGMYNLSYTNPPAENYHSCVNEVCSCCSSNSSSSAGFLEDTVIATSSDYINWSKSDTAAKIPTLPCNVSFSNAANPLDQLPIINSTPAYIPESSSYAATHGVTAVSNTYGNYHEQFQSNINTLEFATFNEPGLESYFPVNAPVEQYAHYAVPDTTAQISNALSLAQDPNQGYPGSSDLLPAAHYNQNLIPAAAATAGIYTSVKPQSHAQSSQLNVRKKRAPKRKNPHPPKPSLPKVPANYSNTARMYSSEEFERMRARELELQRRQVASAHRRIPPRPAYSSYAEFNSSASFPTNSQTETGHHSTTSLEAWNYNSINMGQSASHSYSIPLRIDSQSQNQLGLGRNVEIRNDCTGNSRMPNTNPNPNSIGTPWMDSQVYQTSSSPCIRDKWSSVPTMNQPNLLYAVEDNLNLSGSQLFQAVLNE